MNSTDVIDFWFGAKPLARRKEWFVKDPAFDARIRDRFGQTVEHALTEPLHWKADPQQRLAEIIVLDQFTRNLYRGQSRAFAGDGRALALAQSLIDDGADQQLHPIQRSFAYLPLEHAENLAMQARCVALYEALVADDAGAEGNLDYARRHRDVIERFGRFPHRNAALGRESTPAERDYLAQPGSGF